MLPKPRKWDRSLNKRRRHPESLPEQCLACGHNRDEDARTFRNHLEETLLTWSLGRVLWEQFPSLLMGCSAKCASGKEIVLELCSPRAASLLTLPSSILMFKWTGFCSFFFLKDMYKRTVGTG